VRQRPRLKGFALARTGVLLNGLGALMLIGAVVCARTGGPQSLGVALLVAGPLTAIAGFICVVVWRHRQKRRSRERGLTY